MIKLTPPPAKRIAALSPTAFDDMRACRLRASFNAQGQARRAQRTAPQALGDLCHAVLETLVETRAILGPEWEGEVDRLWDEFGESLAGEIHARGHDLTLSGPVETWPGQRLKRARLRKAAGRLHALLQPLPGDVELVTEEPLKARSAPLQGRPDLIVRSSQETWIVDYKTGQAVEAEGVPREAYVRQLLLYGLLEAEASGRWPSKGILAPLGGREIIIEIDSEAAIDLAREASQLLADYNATAPGPQPGSPSAQVCRLCQHSPYCPSLWAAYDEEWAPDLRALRGQVRECARAAIGSVTLLVETDSGKPTWVQGVSLAEHPEAATIRPGQEVALTSLRAEDDGRVLSLPRWGRLAVLEESAA